MRNYIKKIKLSLIILALMSHLFILHPKIDAAERVPAENIEQFVDVFNRIKDVYYLEGGINSWIENNMPLSGEK